MTMNNSKRTFYNKAMGLRILAPQQQQQYQLPLFSHNSTERYTRRQRTTNHHFNLSFSAMSTVGATKQEEDDDIHRSVLPGQNSSHKVFDGVFEEALVEEQTPTENTGQTLRNKTPREMLENLELLKPPDSANLEETQIWFECLSQRESVRRYQEVISSARKRKDYASLSLVQKQVLEWYQPLKEEFELAQRSWLTRIAHEDYSTSMVEGPNLCVLQPQKLAVIAAHEAIVSCLLDQQCSALDLSRRLAEAVETECNVQLALYSKAAQERKGRQTDSDDDIQQLYHEKELKKMDSLPSTEAEQLELDNPMFAINDWSYGATHLRRFLLEANYSAMPHSQKIVARRAHKKARQILNNKEPWSIKTKVNLGALIVKILLKVTTVMNKGTREPAFIHTVIQNYLDTGKSRGLISLNQCFNRAALKDEFRSFSAFTTRYKPMVVPPKKWMGPESGGYLWLKTNLMRTHNSREQGEALHRTDLSMVYHGLNILGQVPWKINETVFNAAERCWNDNIALGDIPSQTDVPVPREPSPPEPLPKELREDQESEIFKNQRQEYFEYRVLLEKHMRAKQRNMDLNSLRCSAMLKLDQAEQFRKFDEIFFPYNLDFRGRAYPVPPHLSTVGSDLCRGLLIFAKKKPLGERGFYWLKVHLANLGGNDKVSFDDRAKFTEGKMDSIRAAVEDPFGEDRWWMELDDPFQGLATCHEIINAIDSGDPATYLSSLPVHMDGSCNGLQHYAALGRDTIGGSAVNLVAAEKPQDVYSGVMHEVIRRVAEEAERELNFGDKPEKDLSAVEKKALRNNRAAKLVNGLVDRGVVKRTVMTSVYGVTFVGARAQIKEKIEEKLLARGDSVDDMRLEIREACSYLATMTMDVMDGLFVGARDTMNWLKACARLISKQGNPVAWISPIGVPVVQPYRQNTKHALVTLLQTITIINDADDLPLHRLRQTSAFPPNYIHSLDSSHMLLTALAMERRGLTFSAVHDSFWTHACDVDEMNEALRDCFIELYEQPLLETLKKTWEMRYPSIQFPDLPPRGELDLRAVKDSPYFFQ